MQVVDDLGALTRGRPAILTVGAFDGVHRGHQYLIRQVVDRARRLDYQSIVVTFDPRPQVTLRPGSQQLTDGREKIRIIGALGVDVLAVLPFTPNLAAVPAGQFLVAVLEHVNLGEIWVGADFAFGHNREGDVQFLIRGGQSSGFAVHVVARQTLHGVPVSSTIIREHIQQGDVMTAVRLLGHYLRLQGEVISGHGRGKGLGYPTANLRVAPEQMLPGNGIYAAHTWVDGRRYEAAVSIGSNPTFGEHEVTVEPYLLDFSGDIRGQSIALDLVEKIRDEQRFESTEELVAAIGRDVEETRRILARADEPGELILQEQ